MWHEHDGKSWPEHAHPEDRVEVQYRDGEIDKFRVDELWAPEDLVNLWVWQGLNSDVVRYRLV